jgi:hypothetical protein
VDSLSVQALLRLTSAVSQPSAPPPRTTRSAASTTSSTCVWGVQGAPAATPKPSQLLPLQTQHTETTEPAAKPRTSAAAALLSAAASAPPSATAAALRTAQPSSSY